MSASVVNSLSSRARCDRSHQRFLPENSSPAIFEPAVFAGTNRNTGCWKKNIAKAKKNPSNFWIWVCISQGRCSRQLCLLDQKKTWFYAKVNATLQPRRFHPRRGGFGLGWWARMSHQKKSPLLSIESWLFNEDNLLWSPHNWVV